MRLILALLLLPSPVFALPETDLGFAREGIHNIPRFAAEHVQTGVGGVRIHSLEFRFPQNPLGAAVVIVPGRGESAGKYFETAYDLGQGGVGKVFVLDHRGQGFSGRMLPDPQKGHVENFDDYVADLSRWMDEIVLPRSVGRQLVLVAHSMGGAITARYLASISGTMLPLRFSALVYTSPMFGIAWAGAWLERLAEISCKPGNTACTGYVQGTGPYDPARNSFEDNVWTSSRPRFEVNREYYETYPAARVGGPTWSWLRQALLAMKGLRERRNLSMPFPITLFSAGGDRVVSNEEEAQFCRAQSRCRLVTLPNAQHSLMEERDEWRSPVLDEILRLTR